MIRKIKNRLRYRRAKRIGPEMIYGYTNAKGVFLKDTRISNFTRIENSENLEIDDNVFIGHFNFVEASNGIRIGEGCQITNYVSILSHSSHMSIRLYGKEYRRNQDLIGYVKGSVEIGAYTFIGPHTTILPGSKIGKGCIVSAYSLVDGEYPDFTVIKGNPAQATGDIRKMDQRILDKHPELKAYYQEWAGKENVS